MFEDVITAGHGTITFTIENSDTGETRQVVAWDEEDLGERIADGEFDDDEDEDEDEEFEDEG